MKSKIESIEYYYREGFTNPLGNEALQNVITWKIKFPFKSLEKVLKYLKTKTKHLERNRIECPFTDNNRQSLRYSTITLRLENGKYKEFEVRGYFSEEELEEIIKQAKNIVY